MAGPDVPHRAPPAAWTSPGARWARTPSKVLRAIDDVYGDDGVLVLMDLGSAVLSAELAVDLADEDRRERLLVTEAPLVEGAVAAAVAAGIGGSLEEVAAAARGGLSAKAAHLAPTSGARNVDPDAGLVSDAGAGRTAPKEMLRVRILNRLGLHARPAALLVRTASGFDADVSVADATSGRGPVSARSLNGVATLGARRGDDLVVTATGPQATEALAALARLAEGGFGEPEDLGPQEPEPTQGGRADGWAPSDAQMNRRLRPARSWPASQRRRARR